MIHLALSILAGLFLCWFFFTSAVLVFAFLAKTWQYWLGGIVLIALVVLLNTAGTNLRTESTQAPQAQFAPIPAPTPTPSPQIALVARDAIVPLLRNATPEDTTPSIPFGDRASQLRYAGWTKRVEPMLGEQVPPPTRRALLATVWYESRRAGLTPELVLALMDVTSGFRKYAISKTGARGYMQVGTHWAREIGDGDAAKLFILQPNLRFGCVILRSYLDNNHGDLRSALIDYFHQGGGSFEGAPSLTEAQFADSVLSAQRIYARANQGDSASNTVGNG